MAKNSRWSRYKPPAEKRNEMGQPVTSTEPPRKPKRASKPKIMPPKAKTTSSVKLSGWIKGLIALAIIIPIVVVIVVSVKASNGDGDSSNPDIDTSLLNEAFIGSSLSRALEVEGPDAVSLRLSEYGMTVEYFDPNKRESRYFETNDYVDGYEVRVEKTHYDDYQPRPFDLSTIDAATLVEAVEDALTRTDDIYTYSLWIDADRETGEVSMVVSVSGDESVEITSAP